MMPHDLNELVAEAGLIYLTEWEGLVRFDARREVTPASILAWTGGITHTWARTKSVWSFDACADYERQEIRYNPHYLKFETNRDMVLDLVLHEMGHLFTYHFNGTRGHDWRWQQIGATVGYAWVGCTTDERRLAYVQAAKQERLLRSMQRAIEKAA